MSRPSRRYWKVRRSGGRRGAVFSRSAAKNSPGGSVSSGFAIYDTMQYVKPPISTVAVGMAASFATVLLMAGAKGRRFALPNARIHLHQPLIGGRGLRGQATDLEIHAKEILR